MQRSRTQDTELELCQHCHEDARQPGSARDCPCCDTEDEVKALRQQLAGAVEALREVVRLRSRDGKDVGVKADLMAQAAQEALWKLDPYTTGGQ